jgi:beta-glucanase (GH16 family)
MRYFPVFISLFFLPFVSTAQVVQDNFEGGGTITTWLGDACAINTQATNPHPQGINTSAKVLSYADNGGLYANARFQIATTFNLVAKSRFTLKIFVEPASLTGAQPNQISLKLQNGSLAQPWDTQCEIIKPIIVNQWQTVSFDFANDVYINLNAGSLPPTQRTDFNRVVIQINGENNTDNVVAYIDDLVYDAPPTLGFNTLVWADEFDINGAVNATKWFPQTQLPASGSWFNSELQHYTNRLSNAFVGSDMLNIVAKKENFTDQGQTKSYTSARLNSKFAFKYGRVEMRAKLPTGAGTWPAFWMLGKNVTEAGAYWQTQGFGTTDWPVCGEIDIMEHWGTNQNFVQSATHTPSSFGNTVNLGGRTIATASTDFHIYTLEWTADKLVFKTDGITHYTYNPAIKDATNWPFNAEQYLLLNIAIDPNITANYTQSTMLVDYVRVYQGGVVATESVENQAIKYYPNPVQDELNIEIANGTPSEIPIKIYDVQGGLVKTAVCELENGRFTLKNLNNLPVGLYFLSYEYNGKQQGLKFLKA